MRITINVSTELGNAIKTASDQEEISVSAFVSSCVEAMLGERQRRKLAKAVSDIAGKTKVASDVFESLSLSRMDHENRV